MSLNRHNWKHLDKNDTSTFTQKQEFSHHIFFSLEKGSGDIQLSSWFFFHQKSSHYNEFTREIVEV